MASGVIVIAFLSPDKQEAARCRHREVMVGTCGVYPSSESFSSPLQMKLTLTFHLHLTPSFHVHVSLTRSEIASWDDKAHCVVLLASLTAAA